MIMQEKEILVRAIGIQKKIKGKPEFLETIKLLLSFGKNAMNCYVSV